MTTRLPAFGIDLAKHTFDVHLLAETKVSSHHFANTPQGFAALDQWLKHQGMEQVHACMEATGTYGDAASPLLVSRWPYSEHCQSRTHRGLSYI
jgi:transposase